MIFRTVRPLPLGAGIGAVMLVALWACSPANPASDEAPGAQEEEASVDLATTLGVETGSDGVEFRLHVTNASPRPVTLHFGDGQRYDFVVRGPDGGVVWRWSADQMFTQAVGKEVLPAGESLRYGARWSADVPPGTYQAVGVVTARERDIRETTSFVLE